MPGKIKRLIISLGLSFGLILALSVVLTLQPGQARALHKPAFASAAGRAAPAFYQPPANCYAQLNSNPAFTYTSLNADALQEAIDDALPDDVVKVAGLCAGVQFHGGSSQTAYISKSLTLRGGYTTTNWSNANPSDYPTILDAQTSGRVIYITGSEVEVTLEDLILLNGRTLSDGGGIYFAGKQLDLRAQMIISGSQALNDGGGIYNDSGSVSGSGVTINENSALARGGGILNKGTLSLNNSQIVSNTTLLSGGGVHNLASAVANFTDTDFKKNQATTAGGGVFNAGQLTLTGSILDQNEAISGAGIRNANGSLTLSRSTVSRNKGNGLENAGSMTVINSTISTNQGRGLQSDGPLLLSYSTIANNGSGLMVSNGVATIDHTIIDNNGGNNCALAGAGQLNSLGYNLASDGTCTSFTAGGDLTNTQLLLEALQLNLPGRTETHALKKNSPAVDRDPNNDCASSPSIDQRGAPREAGACDSGAYELVKALIRVDLSGPSLGALGLVYTFTATVTPTNSTKPIKYTWEATEQVGSTSDKNTITATQNYSWTTPGLKAITVTAKNLGSTVVATHKITIGLADLMVTGLDTPDPVALGGNISYLITVTNKGPLTATGIIITDTLPQEFFSASLVLNENQPTVPPENGCTLVGNLFICKRNTPLPSGASFSLSLALAPQSTGLLTNHIEVLAQEFDPNPANNQADVATTVGAAFVDVAVSQSASSTSTLVGQPLTYTLEIRNNGQAEALGVSLTDQLPAGVLVTQWSATPGLNCASPTTMVSCSLGQLPVGVPATITLVVVPGEAGPLTNTVTGVASVGQDTTPADNIHILVVKALYQRYLPLILKGN